MVAAVKSNFRKVGLLSCSRDVGKPLRRLFDKVEMTMNLFEEKSAVGDLLRSMWRDIQNASRAREIEKVKADPDKHRTTRIMAEGTHTGYSYFRAGKRRINKKRRDEYTFCVSTHKNAADVFLIWRQVDRYKLVRGKWKWFEAERVEFQWSPSKKEALGIARKKAAKLKADCDHEAVQRLPNAPREAQDMLARAIG